VSPAPELRIDLDAGLVEQAVQLALGGHRLERRYRIERNLCYAKSDAGEREQAFRELHARFSSELELDRPLRRALTARSVIAARVERVCVTRAPSAREEGADLFANPGASADGGECLAIGLALTVETLSDPERLSSLLEREMMHVADLLDPDFAFDPQVQFTGPPARWGLLQERYRALWRTSVEGRVARESGARNASTIRAACRAELARLMRGSDAQLDRLTATLFDRPRPSHSELLALAERGLKTASGTDQGSPEPGSPCSLCGFPNYQWEPAPESLSPEVLRAIASDFPEWQPAAGLCPQCADIYRSRSTAGQVAS